MIISQKGRGGKNYGNHLGNYLGIRSSSISKPYYLLEGFALFLLLKVRYN